MTPRVHPLTSSAWLRSATLCASVLTIAARDGGVLVYGGVPAYILGHLLRAKSPGAYYVSAIKGRYPLLSSISAPKPVDPERDLEGLLRQSLAMHGAEA